MLKVKIIEFIEKSNFYEKCRKTDKNRSEK